MAKAAVGAARIEMSINSATFERQMERARKATTRYKFALQNVSKQFRKTGKQWQRAGKSLMRNITMPMVGAVTGLIALQKATGNYADRLLDLEQITGISTTALQEWRNVARIAGVESDALSNAASGLTRRMRQISEESGAAYRAAEKLGINFKDSNGKIRDTESVMSDAIRKLSQMEAGLERSSIANDIFGRRWEEIAPILGLGANEIENAKNQAHEMGSVMSREALVAANEFRKKMEELTERIKASGRSLAVDLLPLVQDKLIPLFENAISRMKGLTGWFTRLDTESQKRILSVIAAIGLMPPAIFAVGTAFIAISATISALLSPITAVVAAIGGLGAAVIYIWDNWKAVKERISDVSWWRNMVINMIQFINDQFFRRIFDGFNAIFKFIGGATLANPFDAVSKGLDALKADTKEYEHQFGSFTEAVMNGFRKLTGFDLSGMFKKAAATIDEQFGEGIGRRTFEIDMKINPPDKAQLVQVGRTMEDIIAGMESRWSKFKKKFEEIGGEFKSFLAGEMSSAVLSFGDALGRSLSGAENSWKTTFEKIITVVLEFAESLAKLAAGIGAVMMFIPGLQGKGAGLLVAAAALQALTSGFRAGIEKRAANRQSRAQETKVNDALLRSDGSVVRFHPDDDILAMKDFGDLGKQFSNQSTPQQMNNRPQQAHVSVNIQGREIIRAIEDILYKYNR